MHQIASKVWNVLEGLWQLRFVESAKLYGGKMSTWTNLCLHQVASLDKMRRTFLGLWTIVRMLPPLPLLHNWKNENEVFSLEHVTFGSWGISVPENLYCSSVSPSVTYCSFFIGFELAWLRMFWPILWLEYKMNAHFKGRNKICKLENPSNLSLL